MKRTTTSDKSAPYRTTSLAKITAPKKAEGEPKVTKISSDTDLRSGKRR